MPQAALHPRGRWSTSTARLGSSTTLARRRGSTKLWLSTGGHNDIAQSLYEALGGTRSPFRMEPLGPRHNERDHDAWMSSIDHIRATPDFPDGRWPTAMTLDANLADLERHARDFEARAGFTYSILDGDDVIGCVYIYPSTTADAAVSSWVRASRAGMDVVTWHAISTWLETDWPFGTIEYGPRSVGTQQFEDRPTAG